MAIILTQYAYRREGESVALGKLISQKSISLGEALVWASNMLYSGHYIAAKLEEMGKTEVAISYNSFLPEESEEIGLGPGLWHGYWYVFSQPIPALPAPSFHDIFQFKEMLMGYDAPEGEKPEKAS